MLVFAAGTAVSVQHFFYLSLTKNIGMPCDYKQYKYNRCKFLFVFVDFSTFI